MDRRDFIKKGTAGATGFAAVGAPRPKEAPRSTGTRPEQPADMEKYLEQVDYGVERISGWPVADMLGTSGESSGSTEELVRKSMLSLYMAGMFGDLSVENQLHPGMQDRMWSASSTMDEALDEVTTFLQSRSNEELERVRTTLRDRPDVLRQVVGLVDEQAERSGISDPRRAQLRAMFNDVAWRFEHQAPSLLIDEYVGKVQKLAATDVEDAAHQRWLMAKIGEEVFWQAQESLRDRRISRGLKAMGIGVALFLVGAALVSLGDGDGSDSDALVWIGLVPGITGGSITFVFGLITLLVGLATSEDAT
ncbi:MAG: hypothetical protein R3253_08035 [Longimicrobiales bacterium]|nr:hypothetical protein [Longimicrobiales bacterium]